MDHDIKISVVKTFPELLALKEAWDGLHAQHHGATVFNGHAYACAWWKAFGKNSKLNIVVLRKRGIPIAIFPLIKSIWLFHGLPIRQLSLLRNHHVLRNDILLSDDADPSLRALLRYLKTQSRHWDTLLLENIPAHSEVHDKMQACTKNMKLRVDPWITSRTHRFLPMNDSWDDYLSQRSGNFRWQMKKFRKRLDQVGSVEIERYAARDEMRRVLPLVFELEKRSWQGQAADSAMQDGDRLFQQDLVQSLPDHELGEIWLLKLNGQVISSISLLRHNATLYVFTTYYDPNYADASPGTVLYFEMLKGVWNNNGVKVMDFNGDSHAFQRWTSETIPHYRTRIYSNNPYSQALFWARKLKEYVKPPT